jgi:hypothetical protein
MNSSKGSLLQICQEERIDELLDGYIVFCSADQNVERKKQSSKNSFPNLAGFCRYLGIGITDLNELSDTHPKEYERIMTVLEDEALNSGLSATLLSAYLKKRLGYDTPSGSVKGSSQLEICFEHDIMEDGE